MASAWIARRRRRAGDATYRVLFRVGGRESIPKHGGSFRTMREARIRRDWIAGELAAMRDSDIPADRDIFGRVVSPGYAPSAERRHD